MVWWLAGVICVFALYVLQLAAILLLEHRRPAQMAAWMFIAIVLPFIGFIGYLLIATDFTRRKLRRRLEHHGQGHKAAQLIIKEAADSLPLPNRLERLSQFPATAGNRVKVLTDGKAAFAAMLAVLHKAERHIHLDYYTIRDDGVGRDFLEVLVQKAEHGVEVRIVYDGIGSLELTDRYILKLKAAGARIVPFLPPRVALLDRRLNYRNHRKILVVDGAVGFLGGINIGDEYIGGDKRLGFWRDTHLQLEGPSVSHLQELFIQDWAFAAKERLQLSLYAGTKTFESGEGVLIVPSSPGRSQRYIRDVIFSALSSAESRIFLTTPYYIPDPAIRMALRTAALSGIDVRLIIPGIADTKLVLLATLSYVQELLDAGVKVYRYEKGFIHAKVLIVDHTAASVGTANLDLRSLNSNFELNAVLFDRASIARLERDFLTDMRDSRILDRNRFAARPKAQKLKESLASLLSPLL